LVIRVSIANFLVITILILSGCYDKNTPSKTETTVEKSLPAEVLTDCDEGLYPAIYHLPHTSGLFSDDSNWAGQPVTAFATMLSPEEKEDLENKLHQLFESLADDEYRTDFEQTLRQWCSAYWYYRKYSESMSTEELLAEWYSSPDYRPIFEKFETLPMFMEEEADPIDKAASLSSAQSHQLIADWITFVAQYPPTEFENRISGETH
jgi:hypothetical protein